jgi:anti-sigma factor RsiW
MTCRDVAEFLMDYLEGLLPEPQRMCFEEHLGQCPDCVAYLATYRQAVRLARNACFSGADSAPAEIPEDLVRAVLAARQS